ncbi:MAG TPA: YqgE/AlgH family protein [Tepidisphaeraceae bacterium]|nr:YqgE/AlgH family protein [Tepidisphaeraceae bacterium]
MKSLQGQLLVASPQLLDPNFLRSVVLMVQHDEGGALGLILNRPLETTLKEAWEQVSELPCEVEQPLHQGGPCDGPLMVLHTDSAMSDMEVLPGLFFSADKEAVEELVVHMPGSMKFFVGYAGWGPGQLENELDEGGWLTTPATAELVFEGNDEQWAVLVRQIMDSAATWLRAKVIPDDPSVN